MYYKKCIVDTISKFCSNLSLLISKGKRKLFELLTLRKHVTIYKLMRKWIVEFSANLRVVALKLLELTQFASPTLSIYFNFLRAVTSRRRHQEDSISKVLAC